MGGCVGLGGVGEVEGWGMTSKGYRASKVTKMF